MLFHIEGKMHVIQSSNFRYRKQIAGFDYDHTIVKPKSKGTFAKNIDDYMWLRPNVPTIIKDYYKKGYAIVIFTNQSTKWKETQIKKVLDSLEVPYRAYIGFDKKYKKPNPFMFNQYKKEGFNYDKSFYVGDAMGRHGDWSDSDKEFAINSGLTPKTPEEVFPFEKDDHVIVKPHTGKEVVVLMGYPGSGKTTYSKYFDEFENYVVLHGDELKTEAKMKKALTQQLKLGKSVVIDATNPSIAKRDVFLNIAKSNGYYTRIIHLSTSIEESMLRNSNRVTKVPKIVFYVYRKKFEPPSYDEKVDSIITTS